MFSSLFTTTVDKKRRCANSKLFLIALLKLSRSTNSFLTNDAISVPLLFLIKKPFTPSSKKSVIPPTGVDIIGNPKVYKYPIVGYISPTTLRYISIMLELEDYFGSLEGLNICEIGGGYGGQYKIIDSYFKIHTYTIIDLEPSLLLTKKFLSNYKLNSKIEFVKPDELKNSTFDLVISNYAFSELNKISQDDYIHKVINFSNCGFMIYLHIRTISI